MSRPPTAMAWLGSGADPAIAGRVRWLMILRVVVVTVMLGVTVLLQLREGAAFFAAPTRAIYLFIGVYYLLTILYALLGTRHGDRPRFAALQLAVDQVLLSAIVLITGGVASPFLVLYFLIIISAAILFYRAGSFLAAASSAVLYGVAVLAPFAPRVAALADPAGTYLSLSRVQVGYRHLLAVFGFFLVAFLASHLAESLRRVGEELHATSASLAELERRSEHILQNISSGLLTTDLEGRITYFNRAAERITHLAADRLRGRPFAEVFQLHGGRDPFRRPDLLRESPQRSEGSVRGAGGELLLGLTFSPLRDEQERVSGVICSFQDLTQIRSMEEQIRRSDRLAAIGELAAGMAHEIRNPLASLSGSIQLLREELVLDEENRELMDIVTREVGRLNALITDFLQYASPRPLQLEEVDLLAALRETVTLLRQARSGNWVIDVAAREEGGFFVQADARQLRQLFWNLSLNAVEAMPSGGTLRISVERRGGQVQLSFADTGGGIAAGQMEKIFTPFYSTKEGGTGLGLAVVFRIVEAHHGRVEVDGRPDAGAVFRVTLPVRQAAVAAVAALRGGTA